MRSEVGIKLCFPTKQPGRNLRIKSPRNALVVCEKRAWEHCYPALPNYPAKACYWLLPVAIARMASEFHINQRLSYFTFRCTVRYIGNVKRTTGEWLGVEWDTLEKGKHSGEYQGKKYFECQYLNKLNSKLGCANIIFIGKLPGAGSFIRPSRETNPQLSFIEGLKRKYTTVDDPPEPHATISVSASKVMEEVGFDKILKKLAQLKELKIVLVDSLNICRADDVDVIRETCPSKFA